MSCLLRASMMLLVAGLLLPEMAVGAVRGLVVKENGSVLATVVDGVVTGEIAVPPGETSNPLEVFWLDDNLVEYQPASPPHSMDLIDGNPTFVTTQLTGTWTFTITGHDAGSSETTFRLLENGSPIFTSEPVPTHSENAHIEADGFLLRQNGSVILHVWQGAVTGQMTAYLGQTSPLIEVVFLSPDSTEFIPDEPEFELRLDIADSSIVKWRSEDQWTFRTVGGAVGTTTFTLNVHHIDHDDFASPTLPAETYSNVAVDPPAGATGLALAAPFPNPVASRAAIRYALPRAQAAELSVFDVRGRRVSTLLDGVQPAGVHTIPWVVDDLSPGLYLVRLRTSDGVRVTRAAVSR